MKGFFKPNNPKKYLGNPKTIVYRSSYELKAMKYFDSHPEVIKWASEEIKIPYISPVDNRRHTYYPDLWAELNSGRKILIEIKPFYKLSPPVISQGKRVKKSIINEVIDYGVNQAKWEAARAFCEEHKWEFLVMTERELGIKVR